MPPVWLVLAFPTDVSRFLSRADEQTDKHKVATNQINTERGKWSEPSLAMIGLGLVLIAYRAIRPTDEQFSHPAGFGVVGDFALA